MSPLFSVMARGYLVLRNRFGYGMGCDGREVFWCKKREGTVRDRIFTRGNIDNTLGVFSRKILQENKRVWYERTYYRKRHGIYESMFLYTIYYYSPIISF